MYRACIFDLDGTLLNTLPTIRHYCNRSLAHFSLHEITFPECRDLCRLPIAAFYQKLLRLGGCPEDRVEALTPQIRDYDLAEYLKDYAYLTEPYPGIGALLDGLSERGVLTAVLTNKPAAVAESLVEQLFPGVFHRVVGQTPHTISKPDPRSVTDLLAELGLAREDCLYVGDTDIDMQTAKAAEVAVAAVTWGYQPREALEAYAPEYMVSAPHELLSLF